MTLSVDVLLDQLAVEGERLRSAAVAAGWDAAVPGLDWDVRTVVAHTGGVHRWATTIVRQRPQDEIDAAYRAVGTAAVEPVADGDLAEWFAAGLDELVMALREAPDDLAAFTFLPAPSPRHFWARRQAHETSIHRSDVEAASGAVTACDVEFSQDGIAELALGFAARRRNALARTGVLALAPTDGGAPWRLTFGGEKTRAEHGPTDHAADGADTVVTGASCEIYRWLWNRPADVTLSGDPEIPRLWAATVKVTW